MTETSEPYAYPYTQAAQLDIRITIPRPIINPMLGSLIDSYPLPELLDVGILRTFASTERDESFGTNARVTLESMPNITHMEHQITGLDGNTVVLSVLTPKQVPTRLLSAIYFVHGGAMVSSDRFNEVPMLLGLLDDLQCVIVSVEYRLAPETRAPGPAEDCYAGIVWLADNAASLGVDPAEIIVCAISGGAALAAAACLMARDRKAPEVPIKAQMLLSPMLDDRCDTLSDKQFEYGVPWNGMSNRHAWKCVLGDTWGTDRVTPYHAPSRATDLSNLPPTYIDAAECEVFRDPAITYAMGLWRCGSTCELHIWPGGVHMFDAADNPSIPLVGAATSAKRAWLKRTMTHARSGARKQ